MKIIKQNPFRVLGLLGNSSERELQKQIGIIKRYAEIGKEKSFDYDLQVFGDLSRAADDVQIAASSIEQAQKKLHYSLFWFIKSTPLDEVALNHLNANTSKASEIWEKTLKQEVTAKNFSAYQNLSTLHLALSTIGDQIDLNELQEAINLKGQLINSGCFSYLTKAVTGNGILIDSDNVCKAFVDEVLESLKPYLGKKKGIKPNDILDLFDCFPPNIQKYLSTKFTDVPISNIENNIEKTIYNRKNNPRDAEEFGEDLFDSTESDIKKLKKLLGKDNVQYQMLANKLASEILQCSIDFFNTLNAEGSEFNPFEDAMKVAKLAKSIGATGQTKNRIEEAIDTLDEMYYQDINQVIAFLEEILGVFEKVTLDNIREDTLLTGRRTVVNEEKIMEVATSIIDDSIVDKLAKSEKNSLINEFNDTIKKVIKIMSYRHSSFFKKKILRLITQLPLSNSLRYNYEKTKLEGELKNLNEKLAKVKKDRPYNKELLVLQDEMTSIKQWQLFRGQDTRNRQISEQQNKIDNLITKAEREQKQKISDFEEEIIITRRKLNNLNNI